MKDIKANLNSIFFPKEGRTMSGGEKIKKNQWKTRNINDN